MKLTLIIIWTGPAPASTPVSICDGHEDFLLPRKMLIVQLEQELIGIIHNKCSINIYFIGILQCFRHSNFHITFRLLSLLHCNRDEQTMGSCFIVITSTNSTWASTLAQNGTCCARKCVCVHRSAVHTHFRIFEWTVT